jgi:hypothetical protein
VRRFRHIGRRIGQCNETARRGPYGRVRLFGELKAVAAGLPVPVSADRLIDVLWGDGQAANPANALQAQIGKLRRPAAVPWPSTRPATLPFRPPSPPWHNQQAGWMCW